MKIKALIDDKKKQRVRDAITRGDTTIFGKKKAESEKKQGKRRLSLDEQKELNEELLHAIRTHDPDGARAAIEKGADISMRTDLPDNYGKGNVIAYAIWYWHNETNRTMITRLGGVNADAFNRRVSEARKLAFEKCLEVIKVLVTNGADVNETYAGMPFLSQFENIHISEIIEVYELLKKYGAKE